MCEKIFLRPSLDEIYDVQWSPDSMFILAGAINSKVCFRYFLCLILTLSSDTFRHPILRGSNTFITLECCNSDYTKTRKSALISMILIKCLYNPLTIFQAEIVRILTKEKESLILTGHTGYVQGVAWDPLDEMVVTQSADRTCKAHMVSA